MRVSQTSLCGRQPADKARDDRAAEMAARRCRLRDKGTREKRGQGDGSDEQIVSPDAVLTCVLLLLIPQTIAQRQTGSAIYLVNRLTTWQV